MHIVSLSANVEKILRFACLFLRFALCKFCEEKKYSMEEIALFQSKSGYMMTKTGQSEKNFTEISGNNPEKIQH